MSSPKVTTDTVKVSRLGCMRKSTVVSADGRAIEHVEVWVPDVQDSTESVGEIDKVDVTKELVFDVMTGE